MSRTYLLIVVGGSRSGKDELVQALQLMSKESVSVVVKHTSRKVRGEDRRILRHVRAPNQDSDTLVYEHFGYKYGVQPCEIWEGWKAQRIQVLILSNCEVISKLRSIFGPLIITIYIHRNARNKELCGELTSDGMSRREIRERLRHTADLHDYYVTNIAMFDHVLLNIGQPEDLIDQMCRLVRYYRSQS